MLFVKIRKDCLTFNERRLDMNIDIKSVLIGVLFTIGILSVMAFDDHEKEIGRYQGIRPASSNDFYVMDTTNGEFVKVEHWKTIVKEIKNNPNKLD